VGFEPTIPVFERAKAVHALDRAATVICIRSEITNVNKNPSNCQGASEVHMQMA
jgi:hypothetical protein